MSLLLNFALGADITETLMQMLIDMTKVIPKIITALFILLIGYILSKFLKKIITKFSNKIGVDKLGEKLNKISVLADNNIELKLSKILGSVVYYFLMLVFIMTAIGALEMPLLADLIKNIILFIPNLIAAIIILLAGLLLADVTKNIVVTLGKSIGMPSANMVGHFVFYFIFINVIIVALSQAGINTDFFAQNISILIAGAVLAFSIGYGFASKDVVSSFLASYYTKDKFSVGDKVTLNGVTGHIIELDKSSVTILSADKKIIIPMNKVLMHNIEIFQ